MEDRADEPLVVIVNQSMAKHCWPGESGAGAARRESHKGLPWATVVGVVRHDAGPARRAGGGSVEFRRKAAVIFGANARTA